MKELCKLMFNHETNEEKKFKIYISKLENVEGATYLVTYFCCSEGTVQEFWVLSFTYLTSHLPSCLHLPPHPLNKIVFKNGIPTRVIFCCS